MGKKNKKISKKTSDEQIIPAAARGSKTQQNPNHKKRVSCRPRVVFDEESKFNLVLFISIVTIFFTFPFDSMISLKKRKD